jgi:hypothetical protein
MLRYSRSPEAPGSGEEQHMTAYEVGAITKSYACSVEIEVIDHPDKVMEQGRTKMEADTIMATWSRVNKGDWAPVAVSVVGAHIVRGELRPNDRIIWRYSKMENVPRWVMNLIKANRPDSN